MRGRWIAVWLLATGCDRVFGIEPTHLADTAVCGSPDEDGDCIEDAHDNCPGLANADQADDDGDGVGNICDPDETSRQTQLSFSPFSGVDLDSWQASTPAWTVNSLAGQIEHRVASDTSLFSQLAVDDVADLTVEATFIYHSTAGTSPPNRMGVWVDTPMGVENGQTCWIDPKNRSAEVEESVGTGNEFQNAIPTAPLSDGDRYTVQLRRVRSATDPKLYCTIFLGAKPNAITPDAGHAGWLTGGYVAISSNGVSADLVDVVTYGPSL